MTFGLPRLGARSVAAKERALGYQGERDYPELPLRCGAKR